MRVWAALVGLGLIGTAGAAPVVVTDDAGVRHVLARPPERIVSLTPHLTELVYAVGAGNRLVGVDAASDYPADAARLPRVGDYSRVRIERILALEPDLILVWAGGNRPADLYALRQLGIPVFSTEARRFDDVPRLLRLLGRVTGQDGEPAATAFEQAYARLRVRYAPAPRVRVFYQIWARPLITVGGTHWISEALAVCGADNVFADLVAAAPVVSREAVLRRAPGLFIAGADALDPWRDWQVFDALPAIRERRFVAVDADRLHRLTPRLIAGTEALCAALREIPQKTGHPTAERQ